MSADRVCYTNTPLFHWRLIIWRIVQRVRDKMPPSSGPAVRAYNRIRWHCPIDLPGVSKGEAPYRYGSVFSDECADMLINV